MSVQRTRSPKHHNSAWCAGWYTIPPGPDNTNLTLLRNSLLGSYALNTGIYKCPGDPTVNVRSYSMDNFMNGLSFDGFGVVFKKEGSITRPAQFFVFIDEDKTTINDSLFPVDMAPGSNIQDKPAAYHNGAGSLSFSDSHAQVHRWSGSGADRAWMKDHATDLQ